MARRVADVSPLAEAIRQVLHEELILRIRSKPRSWLPRTRDFVKPSLTYGLMTSSGCSSRSSESSLLINSQHTALSRYITPTITKTGS
jgi:hypothetical protein